MNYRKIIIFLLLITGLFTGCSRGVKSGDGDTRDEPRWILDRKIIGLMAADRFREALSITDSLLTAGERDPRLLGQRAYALGMTGRREEAVPLFEEAILADYENWWNHFAFGRVLMEMDRVGRALTEFREAKRFCEGEECAEVNRNLAVSYIESGKAAAAHELIEEGLKKDPGNRYLLGLKAIVEARTQPERADTLLRSLEGIGGIDRGVFMEFGTILMKYAKPEEAARAYRRILEQDTDDREAALKLSRALRESGEYDEALELLSSMGLSDTVMIEKAQVFLEQGKFERALEIYGTLPETPGVLAGMTGACRELGKLDKALECGRKLVAMKPESASALINLAAVHGARGELKEAEKLLNRALEIDSGNRTALENLRRLKKAQRR